MQIICRYGNTQNTAPSDKKLNILIYEIPSYLIICRSYKLLNLSSFLADPVHTVQAVVMGLVAAAG